MVTSVRFAISVLDTASFVLVSVTKVDIDRDTGFSPDLLTAAIVFRRDGLSLASVSLDGVSVPEIYLVCKCPMTILGQLAIRLQAWTILSLFSRPPLV